MDAIHIVPVGQRQVEVKLDDLPNDIYQDLLQEITQDTRQLFSAVQGRTPRRTGKLANEERFTIVRSKDRITGEIYIEAPKGSGEFAKAGAEEYGAHNARGQIAAHRMRLDHVFENRLAAPIMVMVQAHTRPPNIAEVAFERGPLAEMGPGITERINAVVEKRVAEVNS